MNGDYAFDITTSLMYGPKAAGVWPAGVSIKGTSYPVGTNRTITVSVNAVLADVNALITANSASPVVITITDDTTVAWSSNSFLSAYQAGAGGVSFAAGAGVTLRAPSGIQPSVQYGTVGASRVAANEWALI